MKADPIHAEAAFDDPPAPQGVLARLKNFGRMIVQRGSSSLTRRILKRMQMINVGSFAEYVDYLEVHPDEFAILFNMILINVTSFFRDQSVWEYLAQEILPRIIKNTAPTGMIRVWSAGCASGEEAFSLAMVLADALGPEDFRDRVKIYGTDVDEEALATARHAAYDPRAVEDLPEGYLERYFDRANGGFAFRPDLRRSIIFGRHDLVQIQVDQAAAPAGFVDCRDAQARQLADQVIDHRWPTTCGRARINASA